MARTLDPVAHAVRRDACLDVATRLIQSKGYEQMSLQDVLDELGASKGAFYHYFDSKEALLAATADRMVEASMASALAAIDPDGPALDKLKCLFAAITQWKVERTDLMKGLMEVWFSDANVIVRDQARRGLQARLTPLLATILRQGIAEEAFSCGCPEHAAGVLVDLILGLNDTASRVFLDRRAGPISFEEVEATVEAYSEAFERILGLPPGSWPLADDKLLHFWFD